MVSTDLSGILDRDQKLMNISEEKIPQEKTRVLYHEKPDRGLLTINLHGN